MIALTTPRLKLREARSDDAYFIVRLLNDPDFLRYIGDRGVRTPEQALSYIDGLRASYRHHSYGVLVVELTTGDKIGLCGLVQRDFLPDADLGFAFLPAYRAQGYAHEAALGVLHFGVHTLNLRRIAAIVQPDNQASLRLLHKLGFKLDRAMRRSTVEPELLALAYFPSASHTL